MKTSEALLRQLSRISGSDIALTPQTLEFVSQIQLSAAKHGADWAAGVVRGDISPKMLQDLRFRTKRLTAQDLTYDGKL